MNTVFKKILPLTILLYLFVLGGFIDNLQAQSSAPAPVVHSINIEAAMRVWQERYHRVTGEFISWPANLEGKISDQYPKNCFYAEDLRDPARATFLVQSLATAMARLRYEEGFNLPREVPILDYYYVAPESASTISDKIEFYQAILESGFPLAEAAFLRDRIFRSLYGELQPNGPLSNITIDNYVSKFIDITFLLSQANILVQPASYMADSKNVSSLENEELVTVAWSEAMDEFASNFENAVWGQGSFNKIGLALSTRYITDSDPPSYTAAIVWTAGRYQLDLSNEWGTANYYPFILNEVYGVSDSVIGFLTSGSLFSVLNINNYLLYPPLNKFTYQKGEYQEQTWLSPLYEPPGPDQIGFPTNVPTDPETPVGDFNQLHAFVVKETQWAHHIDSPTSEFVDCCSSCSTGDCTTPVNTEVRSLMATIGFGSDAEGSLGNLILHANVPSPELATPAALTRNFREDVCSVVDYSRIIPGRGSFNELNRNTYSWNRHPILQFYSPSIVMDIQVESEFRYTLASYHRADLEERPVGVALFDVSGATPFATATIENPNASLDNISEIRITATNDYGGRFVHNFSYDEAEDRWTLTKGREGEAPVRNESLATRTVGDKYIKDRIVRDPATDEVISHVRETYQQFPWNDIGSFYPELRYELVERVLDPEGEALKTTWTYYDDTGLDGPNYAKLKSMESYDGSWERYEYNSDGRRVRTVSPYQNSSPSDPDNQSRVTTYSRELLPDADGDGEQERLEVMVEEVEGQERSRSYTLTWSNTLDLDGTTVCRKTSARTQEPGVAWDDLSNLVTESYFLAEGEDAGELFLQINSNGTAQKMIYTRAANGSRTVTTEQGAWDADTTTVVEGTRTIVITQKQGGVLSRETTDIETGLVTDMVYTPADQFDPRGRALQRIFFDGTTETMVYGCCGLERMTDRMGTETVYEYDGLRRQTGMTRAGIRVVNTLDALGRVIDSKRIGTDASELPLGSTEYAVNGRVLSTTDARGRITLFDREYPNGTGITDITRYADGAESIQETYRDGRTAKVSGAAEFPMAMEYAIVSESHNGLNFPAEQTTSIRLGDDNEETEWTRNYTDMLGRSYKAERPSPDGTTTVADLQFYNVKGQRIKSVAANGTQMLYSYNEEGELEDTALDVNQNDVIDYSGLDRITRRITDIVDDPERGTVYRVDTLVWEDDNSDISRRVSRSDRSANGLLGWTEFENRLSRAVINYPAAGGQVTTQYSAEDTVTVTTLDSRGLTVSESVTLPNGEVASSAAMGYDAFNRLETQTDARNGTTTFTYYPDDQLDSVTSPDPEDGSGVQVSFFLYDSRGRQVQRIEPDGESVYTEYFLNGTVKKIHGIRQYPVAYTYDSQGRMKTMTTWQDFAGEAGAAVTTWNYNPYQGGLLDSKTDADNQSVGYTYTDDGRLKTRTWARNALTTYSYDPATAELLTVDYADSTPDVTYTYDRRGRIDTTSDAAGTLQYSYLQGRLEAETYTAGTFAGYELDRTYDGLDRSTGWSLSKDAASVHTTGYGYADNNSLEAGRLQTVSSGQTTARYMYEANSNLLSETTFTYNNSASLSYGRQWDKLNRLQQIEIRDAASAVLYRSAYTYNNVNQRTQRTLENGEYWNFEYDDLGQVTRAAKYGSDTAEIPGYRYGFTFDDIGNRTETDVNGRTANYLPNVLNEYENREVPRFLDILGEANDSATVTVNGDPALRTLLPGGSDYFYQPLSYGADGLAEYERFRISAEDTDGGGGLLAYDQDSFDYLPPAQEDFVHDEDGNLSSDGRWSYTWDSENRLIEVETLAIAYNAGAPRQKLEFQYDSQGRRFSKKVYDWDATSNSYLLTSSSLYIYDGWNLIAELKSIQTSPFTIHNSYTWGLDLSVSQQGAGGVGGLLTVIDETGSTAYPSYDGNGNVMGYYAADTGESVAEFEYGPFGEPIRATGPMAEEMNFRFSTKYQDAETGLLYYGYRYYNSETGRWLNRDPIEESGGLNLYGMVESDTVNYFDPLGLEKIDVIDYADGYAFNIYQGIFIEGEYDIKVVWDTDTCCADIKIISKVGVGAGFKFKKRVKRKVFGVGFDAGVLAEFSVANLFWELDSDFTLCPFSNNASNGNVTFDIFSANFGIQTQGELFANASANPFNLGGVTAGGKGNIGFFAPGEIGLALNVALSNNQASLSLLGTAKASIRMQGDVTGKVSLTKGNSSRDIVDFSIGRLIFGDDYTGEKVLGEGGFDNKQISPVLTFDIPSW